MFNVAVYRLMNAFRGSSRSPFNVDLVDFSIRLRRRSQSDLNSISRASVSRDRGADSRFFGFSGFSGRDRFSIDNFNDDSHLQSIHIRMVVDLQLP